MLTYFLRTKCAMEGVFTFENALRKRLDIISPSRKHIDQLIQANTFQITKGFIPLVKRLQATNKQIYIISGGFKDLIVPLCNELRIPTCNIYANELIFDSNGNYQNFVDLPTSRTGGKLDVIKSIKNKHPSTSTIVHIGDGITDLETKPEVDLFVGFGGNVTRKIVQEQADWFVTDFDELNKLLYE